MTQSQISHKEAAKVFLAVIKTLKKAAYDYYSEANQPYLYLEQWRGIGNQLNSIDRTIKSLLKD